MNRVDRLMGYMLLFQSRGLMRAQDFAERFEISERTVYRDVQALCEVGVPIMAMPGEGYRLMEGYYLPPITFNPDEARSLYLALSMLAGLTKSGPTKRASKTALDKIRSILPNTTLRHIEALQAVTQFYTFPTNALDFDNDMLPQLQKAIENQNVIRIHYHALHNNSVTEREVEPSELIFLEKSWLLTAYCRLRRDHRTFRLDRIDVLQILSETFAPRETDEIPFESMAVDIVVRFDPAVVRWVRERQHFSLIADDMHPDPAGVVMLYRPRSYDQIEGWLLSWGDQMEVLEPADVRDRLARTAEKILAHHQPVPEFVS